MRHKLTLFTLVLAEVYNYDSTPIPKNPDHSDLEAVQRHNYTPTGRPPNEKRAEARKICGLRVVTFWLALALVVVIIIAAVGGGVGGALANSSSDSGSPTATMTVTQTDGSPRASSTVPSTGFARLYCRNNAIYKAPTGARFKQHCATDWAEGIDAKGGGTVSQAHWIADMTPICTSTFPKTW